MDSIEIVKARAEGMRILFDLIKTVLPSEALRLASTVVQTVEAVAKLAPPTIGQALNVADLDALPPGSIVHDRTGDQWTKLPDGKWQYGEGVMYTSRNLCQTYSPLTLVSIG